MESLNATIESSKNTHLFPNDVFKLNKFHLLTGFNKEFNLDDYLDPVTEITRLVFLSLKVDLMSENQQ